MNISPIRQTFNNISYSAKGKNRPDPHKRPYVENNTYKKISHSQAKSETESVQKLLKSVLKPSKDSMCKILLEYYEFSKEQFPNQKVTVFFNANRKQLSHFFEYSIAVGINGDAEEGIARSEEDYPGFSKCENSDFYHVSTIYVPSKEKVNYENVRSYVISDLQSAIEKSKNKNKF